MVQLMRLVAFNYGLKGEPYEVGYATGGKRRENVRQVGGSVFGGVMLKDRQWRWMEHSSSRYVIKIITGEIRT